VSSVASSSGVRRGHRRPHSALAMLMSALIAVLVGAAVLAACGGSKTAVSTGAPTTTVATSPTVSPSSTVAPLTAAAMVAKLKAAGLPIGTVIVYTAASDPNHLLGRPNGYISAAMFTDKRLKGSEVAGLDKTNLGRGGKVEVFADAGGAKARMKYIQSCLKSMPILGSEYDYVVGTALLRVSGLLTPTQAKAYQAAAQQ